MKIKLLLVQVVLMGTVSAGVLEGLRDVQKALENRLVLRALQFDALVGAKNTVSETLNFFNLIKYFNAQHKSRLYKMGLLSLLDANQAMVYEIGIKNSEKDGDTFPHSINNRVYLRSMQGLAAVAALAQMVDAGKRLKSGGVSWENSSVVASVLTKMATCIVCQNNINKLEDKKKEDNKNDQ